MDFITHLPPSNGKTLIWVIVDRLIKFSHYLAISSHLNVSFLSSLLLWKLYRMHGLPKTIVSDRDPIFWVVSRVKFWNNWVQSFCTQVLTTHTQMAKQRSSTDVWNTSTLPSFGTTKVSIPLFIWHHSIQCMDVKPHQVKTSNHEAMPLHPLIPL